MERRLTEEQVTKAILNWLIEEGWQIICFDFPQSGTGFSLHPNKEIRTTKNKGAIIPDIIAIRETIALFFENKDRFVLDDFIKIQTLKLTANYSASIQKLFKNIEVTEIFYGVGLPYSSNIDRKIEEQLGKIDFAVYVNNDKSITIKYQNTSVFT